MRVSPRAFSLEKAMVLKGVKGVHVSMTDIGTIAIEQWDELSDCPIVVYLTHEQFNAIENWVFKQKEEIQLAWNGGVDDGEG
jgi:hypothetical protein